MARFIHTADWQIGLRVGFIPGDAGALVRDARLKVVRRIGEVAREAEADFVVVAGDVFEHHGLRPETIRKALDAMREVGVPIYLLPGNHDPITPESIWRSALWADEKPDNVHVLDRRDPVEAPGGAVLLPCPLLERHTLDDPTDHLTPTLGSADRVRIGVAHGGIREILEGLVSDEERPPNAVALDAVERGDLDYFALGDWHSHLAVTERVFYPGAPEATRFKERDPGKVLVVEAPARGAKPVVTPVRVAGLSWIRHEAELDGDEDLQALEAWLDGLPDKADTLVQLTLSGAVDTAAESRLEDELLSRASDRLRHLRVRRDGLHAFVRDADLDGIATEGWVREVIDRLSSDDPGGPKAVADRALRLLYRLHRDVERSS